MTVISTVISQYCTAHASDSLITEPKKSGGYKITESERSKIIEVRALKGIMSYWGLAESKYYNWSTYDWLNAQAGLAHEYLSAEEFALSVANKLNIELKKMPFKELRGSGIGIHFTAYEYVNDYWIPELFLISNWNDTSYQSLRSNEVDVGVSREIYKTIEGEGSKPKPEHHKEEYRMKVHEHLKTGPLLVFNNGDPTMFNEAAKSIFSMINEASERKDLANLSDPETYLSMARRPIEIVSNIQKDFYKEGKRVVGGRIHGLAITPNSSEYISSK